MATQKPHQPDSAADALRRVAELHPGVLSVSATGSRPDRSMAAVDAMPDPPPAASAPVRPIPFSGFQRMSNWLRRVLPI